MILKNNKLQDIFEFLNKFIISITLCSGAQSHDDDGVLQSPFCKNFSPQLYPTLLHTSIHTTKAVVSRIGKCEINCILNVILTKGFLQGGSTIGVKYFLEEQRKNNNFFAQNLIQCNLDLGTSGFFYAQAFSRDIRCNKFDLMET